MSGVTPLKMSLFPSLLHISWMRWIIEGQKSALPEWISLKNESEESDWKNQLLLGILLGRGTELDIGKICRVMQEFCCDLFLRWGKVEHALVCWWEFSCREEQFDDIMSQEDKSLFLNRWEENGSWCITGEPFFSYELAGDERTRVCRYVCMWMVDTQIRALGNSFLLIYNLWL